MHIVIYCNHNILQCLLSSITLQKCNLECIVQLLTIIRRWLIFSLLLKPYSCMKCQNPVAYCNVAIYCDICVAKHSNAIHILFAAVQAAVQEAQKTATSNQTRNEDKSTGKASHILNHETGQVAAGRAVHHSRNSEEDKGE